MTLIKHAAAALALAAPALAGPIVDVRNGSYEGIHLPQFGQDLFLGMPYAQDTSAQNRFRIPQSLNETWDGARKAQAYGQACPDFNVPADALYGMGEDCLSINVVRPSGLQPHELLPVMLWIHGGSYQVGTSGLPDYNLTYIVQRSVDMGKPIIGASINYRKGGWGNMYSVELQGSGNTNLALRDMRKALGWVQENIEPFGGDASSVTIWGESSGSFAVGQLLISYGGRSDGLFHRSIQESGSAATAWYNGSDWYQPIYDKIVDQVNCSTVPDTLECLRSVSYGALFPLLQPANYPGPGFYPVVDGDIIPAFPTELIRSGRFAHVPHLYGSNSDEGTDNAPIGIDTSDELRDFLANETGFGFPDHVVSRIMELYPDDPSLGIPLNTGPVRFPEQGWQYKRAAAIMGDVFYHATRLDDARHYSIHDPTYVYRFNTRPFVNETNSTYTDYKGHLGPAHEGVSHFSEVAFVFNNPSTVGPWPEYTALSDQMSSQWIQFAHSGNPNAPGLPDWPAYNSGAGGVCLVLQTEAQGGSCVELDTWRLQGREYLTRWARRRHV